jgi:membrane fusion protein
MELFRREAIDALRTPTLGSLRLATPISHGYAAALSVTICAFIIGWACLGSYTRREHVDGSLVPTAGLVSLSATNSGVVTNVDVQIGQEVVAGQTLVTVSGEKNSQIYGATGLEVSKDMRGEAAQLQADILSARSIAGAQEQALIQQRQEIGEQIKQLDAELVIARNQASSLLGFVTRIRPLLANGYISQLQVQTEESDERTAESEINDLLKQKHQLIGQGSDIAGQLAQLPLSRENKINDLRRQLFEVQQSLATNEAGRLSVVTSPTAGTVSSVLVKSGQNISQSTMLLSIVPAHSPLEAQLLVPSSSIGFVHLGAEVALHYQAFPYQKFGLQRGVVTGVSKSALSPSEITSLLGVPPPTDPMYLVYVRLPSQTVRAYEKDEALAAGMVLDADILLDHRKIVEWIFEPLYGANQRTPVAVGNE